MNNEEPRPDQTEGKIDLPDLKQQIIEMQKNNPQYLYGKTMRRVELLLAHERNDKTIEIVKKALESLVDLNHYYTNSDYNPGLNKFDSEFPKLRLLINIVDEYEKGNIGLAQDSLAKYKNDPTVLKNEEEKFNLEQRNISIENRLKKIEYEIRDLEEERQKLISEGNKE
jgi:hypothetical protein